MKAKDTVIRYQHKHSVIAGSSEWHMIDGYNLGAEAQAEISFKAALDEVGKWLKDKSLTSVYDAFIRKFNPS